MITAIMPVRLPICLTSLPRNSSSASGFFLCRIRLEPVLQVHGRRRGSRQEGCQTGGGQRRMPSKMNREMRVAKNNPSEVYVTSKPRGSRRTSGVRIAALHKLELARRIDDEVCCPAAQVHQVQRRWLLQHRKWQSPVPHVTGSHPGFTCSTSSSLACRGSRRVAAALQAKPHTAKV